MPFPNFKKLEAKIRRDTAGYNFTVHLEITKIEAFKKKYKIEFPAMGLLPFSLMKVGS